MSTFLVVVKEMNARIIRQIFSYEKTRVTFMILNLYSYFVVELVDIDNGSHFDCHFEIPDFCLSFWQYGKMILHRFYTVVQIYTKLRLLMYSSTH